MQESLPFLSPCLVTSVTAAKVPVAMQQDIFMGRTPEGEGHGGQNSAVTHVKQPLVWGEPREVDRELLWKGFNAHYASSVASLEIRASRRGSQRPGYGPRRLEGFLVRTTEILHKGK